MPRRLRATTSTFRRYRFCESLRSASPCMRPYDRCSSRGLEYRKSLSANKYGECIRVSYPYSLIVTPQEFALVNSRLAKIEADLREAREAKYKARDLK
jgi:hypothetical protein